MAEKDTKSTTKKSRGAGSASGRKSINRLTDHGKVVVTSTFNNTIVTITNDKGETLAWSSAGHKGYKGTRKSTPYAAQIADEDAVKRVVTLGLKTADIFIKGPGSGRDSSLRAIKAAGLGIASIADITPVPHNGPRAK